MVVGFMTTYAVSAYHLWQVGGFFPGTSISSTNKTDWNIIENSEKHHDPNHSPSPYNVQHKCFKVRALVSISIRFVPSHINAIFTVNTPILYLSCNKICKKMLFNLIIKKRFKRKPHQYLNSSSGKGCGLILL